nr:MAG: hypothetical protein [Bacteriophage sp.]
MENQRGKSTKIPNHETTKENQVSRLSAEGEIECALKAHITQMQDYDLTTLQEQIEAYRRPKRKRPLTAHQRKLERERKRRYYQAHREERLQHDREQYARIKKEYPRKYEERLAQIREYKRSKRLEQNK